MEGQGLKNILTRRRAHPGWRLGACSIKGESILCLGDARNAAKHLIPSRNIKTITRYEIILDTARYFSYISLCSTIAPGRNRGLPVQQ